MTNPEIIDDGVKFLINEPRVIKLKRSWAEVNGHRREKDGPMIRNMTVQDKGSVLLKRRGKRVRAKKTVELAKFITQSFLNQLKENKTVLKQLKKANASLTQELKECKTNLDETSRALGEATSSRDSCLIALQTKQTELEKYTALNDRTSDYKILQTKLNETLGLLALKDIDIKEGLKTKTYEISVVNQKHDELVKKSLLTRSQFEGQLKEKRFWAPMGRDSDVLKGE
ncbi:hypothetical protein Tco_0565270 [Tanacetum coccineum]